MMAEKPVTYGYSHRLCEPYQCPCGAKVGPEGTHGLACRRSAGRTTRHHALNDLEWRVPTYLQSKNRLVSWGQTASVQLDWRRLANVWPGTSQSPTPWVCRIHLPLHQPLEPPLWTQQTRRAEIPVDSSHSFFHSAGFRNSRIHQFKGHILF